MKELTLVDVTLRVRAASAGALPSFKEKVEIARQMDALRLGFLETPVFHQEKAELLFLHTIAPLLRNTGIAVPVAPAEADVRAAWDAVRESVHPRLVLQIPLSTVQMEYLYHKKAKAMLQTLESVLDLCAAEKIEAEVALLDATRAEAPVLEAALSLCAEKGAPAATLCDTDGKMLPEEFAERVRAAVAVLGKGAAPVALGVECSDALGLGCAIALASVQAGATLVKAAVAADGTVPSLRSFASVMRDKGAALGVRTPMDFTVLGKTTSHVARYCDGERDQAAAAAPASAPAAAVAELHSDARISTVKATLRAMGYALSDDDTKKVFDEFRRIAGRKETVSEKDLDAIVAAVALQVPATYTLSSFVITCGNTISSMANVTLLKDGRELVGSGVGNGPVDAAFRSIETIVGRHFELDDFQVQSVTEGRAAVGTGIVKLRADGGLYSGKGVSTDIVGASIRAYIDALNKICYEEAQRA